MHVWNLFTSKETENVSWTYEPDSCGTFRRIDFLLHTLEQDSGSFFLIPRFFLVAQL